MFISVIISTRDRAERLPFLFDAFARLEIPKGMDWEFLMVDNGSQDETPEILWQEKNKERLPLVCLEQPVPGKSRALNLALTKMRGDFVIFTDDDIKPTPEWIKAYYEATLANPDVLGFAGKVLPFWEGEVPHWLNIKGKFALPRGIINCFDFGEVAYLLPESIVPSGSNVALRRIAIKKMGEFRIDLGPGTSIPYAEDTEYMRRLLKIGGRFLYVPQAFLYHLNSTERMTQAYVEKWIFETARCQVLAFKSESHIPNFLGIPRYLLRQALQRLFFWWFDPRPRNRFQKKLSWIRTLGGIQGHLNLSKFKSIE